MPTARELLEQADALMRRNRQEAARAPSMPAVPAAVEQHASVPRIAAEATPPAPPPVAPEPVVVAHAPASDADIPVLDDAVEALADDDVPVLTDAVDEIEVAAPPVDEGEPSDWLAPPAEDESILGPAPPSVALVPPATLGSPGAATGWNRPAASPAPAAPAKVEPPPELEDFHPEPVDADVTVRRPMPTLGAPVEARAHLPEIEDLAETGATDLDADVTWTRPVSATPAAATAVVAASAAPFSEDAVVAPAEAPAVASHAEPARTPPTGAEWDALAEEIRMQVLQRIDMFTDTGLRERLGARLKPIVDRASADLVDAINQHVGEILRAYVAEAIEREIDRWRSGR
jgi:hypothetical protein